MITHYQSSKGPVAIATMPFPYLQNAHDKLVREGDPSRQAEVDAMAVRLAELEAEHAKESAVEDANPRAVIGDNNPPDAASFAAIRAHMDDLLIEVRNWADGAKIESEAQADEVARLIEQVRLAEKAADEARKEEVRPLDEQRDAIQERYNTYIAPLKNKKPGKLPLASQALKACLAPWLQKLEDEKRAAAEAARKEAEAKALAAAAAIQAAPVDDFGAMEAAEELVADAKRAEATAKRAEGDKAHAQGDSRAVGLRSYFTPMLADPKAALLHYVATRPDDVKSFLVGLAKQDVLNGARKLPGFDIVEERRVA